MLEGCWELSQVGRPDSRRVSPSAAQGVGSWGRNTHPGTVRCWGDEGQTSADTPARTCWQHFQFQHYQHQ